jgi:hypothetical protein
MNSRDWYLRNRSREAIIDMFRVIRHLQLINEFKDSEVMRAMAIVWRESDAFNDKSSFCQLYLFWMVRELEKDERLKKKSAESKRKPDE